MNSTVLMNDGMKFLTKKFGPINAEKFISTIIRERFDYTKWRQDNLFEDMTIEQISSEAMRLYESI